MTVLLDSSGTDVKVISMNVSRILAPTMEHKIAYNLSTATTATVRSAMSENTANAKWTFVPSLLANMVESAHQQRAVLTAYAPKDITGRTVNYLEVIVIQTLVKEKHNVPSMNMEATNALVHLERWE